MMHYGCAIQPSHFVFAAEFCFKKIINTMSTFKIQKQIVTQIVTNSQTSVTRLIGDDMGCFFRTDTRPLWLKT